MKNGFITCPDSHRCENGSSCAHDLTNEGSYYCDCSTADSQFVGLYCEFPADVECSYPQVADKWYCANEGTCTLDVSNAGITTTRCDCTEDYSGDFCEFVSGAAPDGWPGKPTQALNRSTSGGGGSSGNGLEAGIKAVIVIVVLAVIGLFAVVIVRRQRGSGEIFPSASTSPKSHKADPSQALNIEADGSTFRDIVKSMSSPNSNEDYDLDIPDEMSIEVDMERANSPSYEAQERTSNGGRII